MPFVMYMYDMSETSKLLAIVVLYPTDAVRTSPEGEKPTPTDLRLAFSKHPYYISARDKPRPIHPFHKR